jgi:hypothetical protein
MDPIDKEFITEVYSLVVQIEELIKKYEYEDKVMSAIVIGLMQIKDDVEEGDEVQLQSVFSYNLDGRVELEVIKELMDTQYEDPDDDIDTLLGDLGISLN